MNELRTWSGGAVWMLVATLMMFAALQPVEVSAAVPAAAAATVC